jgi:hypothetical protein
MLLRNKKPVKRESVNISLTFHLVLMKVKSKKIYGSKGKEKRQIEPRKMTELH